MASKPQPGKRRKRAPNHYALLLQAAGIPQLPDDLLAAIQGDHELSPQDERRADAVISAACWAIRRMQSLDAWSKRRSSSKSRLTQ